LSIRQIFETNRVALVNFPFLLIEGALQHQECVSVKAKRVEALANESGNLVRTTFIERQKPTVREGNDNRKISRSSPYFLKQIRERLLGVGRFA